MSTGDDRNVRFDISEVKMFEDQEHADSLETPGAGVGEIEADATTISDRKSDVSAAPRKSYRKALLRGVTTAALLLVLAGCGYYGHYWWTAGRYLVTTDDAYVGAKSATLAPKVS